MKNCKKHHECGRLAYRDGLCIPHIKGWKPEAAPAVEEPAPAPKKAATPRKRTTKKAATPRKRTTKKATPAKKARKS